MPTIMAMTIIDASPEIAKIPRVASTHIIRSTPAICLNGDGSTPMTKQMTAKISKLQSVMGSPLITNS